MAPTLQILAIAASSVAAMIGIASAIGVWTLRTWADPLLPTLYMASALFVVFIAMGIGWFIVTRRELERGIGAEGKSAEERGFQRLLVLTANVLLGVIALGVIAAWNVDAVRAQFVPSRVTHIELERVLEDPSPIVRLRACEELFQRGWVFRSKKALIAAVDPEPAMATKCLQTAKENGWKGVGALASTLSDGWTAQMMRTVSETQRACELAPWNPVMSELAEQPSAPRLLHCATNAASDDVRFCCAQNLVARGALLDQLGDAPSFSPEATEKVFASLVRYAFQPLSLPAKQQQVASTLGTDDEVVRRWVVEVGCYQIDPSVAQREILGGLMPLVEADSCGLSPAQEAEYRSPVAWGRLCQQVLEDQSDTPVQQVVCASVQDAEVEKAVDEAGALMHHAIRAPFLEQDAEFVETGLTAAVAMGGGGSAADAQKNADFLSSSAVKELGLMPMSTQTCTKMDYNMVPGRPPEITKRQSFDCKRYREDLTVGEYLAQYQARQKEIDEAKKNPFTSKRVKAALAKRRASRSAARAAKREFGQSMKTAFDSKK